MDIKDVKVGDRCWVQWFHNPPTDENGQNATVVEVRQDEIKVRPLVGWEHDAWKVNPDNFFWRKPEAPPKPKRMVEKRRWCVWTNPNDFGFKTRGAAEIVMRTSGGSKLVCCSWEDEE